MSQGMRNLGEGGAVVVLEEGQEKRDEGCRNIYW